MRTHYRHTARRYPWSRTPGGLRRLVLLGVVLGSFVLTSAPASAGIDRDARHVGHTLGTAAREVGHKAKHIGLAIGHEAKKAGLAVGHAAKAGGLAFWHAVKGRH